MSYKILQPFGQGAPRGKRSYYALTRKTYKTREMAEKDRKEYPRAYGVRYVPTGKIVKVSGKAGRMGMVYIKK